MHAGVLPGYPASHGCIRMPMAFAVKMWNWTKMGARVIVTPGQMTPASFSHPLLVAQKIVPQPSAAGEPQMDAPPAAKSDKASEADPTIKLATSEMRLELRSTVGHDGDRTRTADAGGDLSATKATMTDAAPSGGIAPSRAEDAASITTGDASKVDAKSETAKPDAEPAAGETAASDEGSPATEIKSGEITATAEPLATGSVKDEVIPGEKKAEAKTDDVKAAASQPDAPKSGERPDESLKASKEISAPAKKDQAHLPDTEKPAVVKPDPAMVTAPKRSGQIAMFISRKDSKLYVRQNFAPLFEAPVTIAPSDRPLGTHVFTAQVDKGDANVLHWSVVSLPAPSRYVERRDEDERASRRRKMAGAVEVKGVPVPPNSPTEALDRLTIPADAMARITEALSTGGSIIVSDQGIAAGETGEGTDFIVSLR